MKSSELLFNGQVLDVRRVPKTLLDGRNELWEIASYRNNVTATGILGYCHKQNSLIMVENYRPSIGRWNLEIAGGLPIGNESLEDTAKREFEEETGWKVDSLHYIKTFYGLPGCGLFPIACFLAESSESADQRLDRNEFVKVRLINRKTLQELISSNLISEPTTLCILQMFLNTKIYDTD